MLHVRGDDHGRGDAVSGRAGTLAAIRTARHRLDSELEVAHIAMHQGDWALASACALSAADYARQLAQHMAMMAAPAEPSGVC